MNKKNTQLRYRPLASSDTALWHSARGLNEMCSVGAYIVQLRHDYTNELLPLPPCGEGHYIDATLFVTESGSDDRLQRNRVIGQTLILPQCNDGKLHTFSRTNRTVASGNYWSAWSRVLSVTDLNATPATITEVSWDSSSCIDTFITAGIYNISGERLNVNDRLPIDNSNPGHTIHARLVVLDSSIRGNGQNEDKCITQILTLSNRTAGDGEVYIRTGRASNKNQLAGGYGWEPWGKLQQNINVGQVTSLNSYIENGMYSGVYVDGKGLCETFVMVVINNYAVAGSMGQVRSVSQFKYALNVDSTFSYKCRSGQGNTGINWNEWVNLNDATAATLQDGTVTSKKLSSEVREKVENPLRPLFIAAGAEYNNGITDKTKTAPWGETVVHKAGYYYLNGLGDITEDEMIKIYNYREAVYRFDCARVLQSVDCRTIFPMRHPQAAQILVNRPVEGTETFRGSKLEVLYWSVSPSENRYNHMPVAGFYNTFQDCDRLRVIGFMDCSAVRSYNNTFNGCMALEYVKLYGVCCSVSFAQSPSMEKESVLFMIQNANPTSVITITLHPDAYARLANDADVVAALEAQPLISLVSA